MVQLGPWHVTGVVNISLAFVFRRPSRSACRGPFLFRAPGHDGGAYALHCTRLRRDRFEKPTAPFMKFFPLLFLPRLVYQMFFFSRSTLKLCFNAAATNHVRENVIHFSFFLSFYRTIDCNVRFYEERETIDHRRQSQSRGTERSYSIARGCIKFDRRMTSPIPLFFPIFRLAVSLAVCVTTATTENVAQSLFIKY